MGYLKRQPRYVRLPDGTYKQLPGLLAITLKGARKLYDQGVEGAARLSKEILGWIRGGDQRFPAYQAPATKTDEKSTTEDFTSMKGVLIKLGYAQ